MLGAIRALLECGPAPAALALVLLLLSPGSAAASFVPGPGGAATGAKREKGSAASRVPSSATLVGTQVTCAGGMSSAT